MVIDAITRIDDRSCVIRYSGYHDPRNAYKQKMLRLMGAGDVASLASLGWKPLEVEAEDFRGGFQAGLDRCGGL